jgi:hypothetical protein
MPHKRIIEPKQTPVTQLHDSCRGERLGDGGDPEQRAIIDGRPGLEVCSTNGVRPNEIVAQDQSNSGARQMRRSNRVAHHPL